MNEKRIAIGLAAWFLGIIVPVYHHVGLHAALVNDQTNNIVTRMNSVFEYLPWIDWVYLALMFGVGAVLVISGLFVPTDRSAGRAGPRGFDVVGVSGKNPTDPSNVR